MKIISIKVKDNMIKVTTDNETRAEFVYKSDKFENLEDLTKEIEKSIYTETKHKEKKEKKLSKLIKELKVK